MQESVILSVKNLSVVFKEHIIFSGISLELKRDEILAVIGPNGAGKTVFLKCLLGLIPYSGTVRWAKDVRFGYVPQRFRDLSDFPITVSEFLSLTENRKSVVKDVLKKLGFRERTDRCHKHLDLNTVLNTQLSDLSGGEIQRILMANALFSNPNVLLLDEPTAGVDLEGEKKFYELFSELKKEKDLTIIFVTHDLNVVKKYAEKVLDIEKYGS